MTEHDEDEDEAPSRRKNPDDSRQYNVAMDEQPTFWDQYHQPLPEVSQRKAKRTDKVLSDLYGLKQDEYVSVSYSNNMLKLEFWLGWKST